MVFNTLPLSIFIDIRVCFWVSMCRLRINPCYLNWWPGNGHSVFTQFLSVIPPIKNQLRSITSFKTLEQKLHGMEYDDFNNWFRQLGFLHNPKHCESCGERMTQQRPRGKSREGYWRCNSRQCHRYKLNVGFAKGTFFENAKIPPIEVFRFF